MELLKIEENNEGISCKMAVSKVGDTHNLSIAMADIMQRDSLFRATVINSLALYLSAFSDKSATEVLAYLNQAEQRYRELRQKITNTIEGNENNQTNNTIGDNASAYTDSQRE